MHNRPAAPSRLRLLLTRLNQILGWPGITGIGLLLVAGVGIGMSWSAIKVQEVSALSQPYTSPKTLFEERASLETTEPPEIALTPLTDIAKVLRQVSQIAGSNGIGWTSATYRVTAATVSWPSTLEIRSTVKGPYPKLRKMVKQILAEVHMSALRELSIGRPGTEVTEVEVKLTIAVPLEEVAVPAFVAASGGGR